MFMLSLLKKHCLEFEESVINFYIYHSDKLSVFSPIQLTQNVFDELPVCVINQMIYFLSIVSCGLE